LHVPNYNKMSGMSSLTASTTSVVTVVVFGTLLTSSSLWRDV